MIDRTNLDPTSHQMSSIFSRIPLTASVMVLAVLVLPAFGQDFSTFSARNGIEIEYTVLTPEGDTPARGYEAVVAFEGAHTTREEAINMIDAMWSDSDSRSGWIIVVPLTPGEDWRTHPNHHALNDLMDHVAANHPVHHNRFSILGYGQEGTDIASTWSGMSREYFDGLYAVDGAPYARWDDGELSSFLSGRGGTLTIYLLSSSGEQEHGASMERFMSMMHASERNPVFVKLEGHRVPLASLDSMAEESR